MGNEKWEMENGKWKIISCAGAWNDRQRGGTKSRSLRGNGGLRGLPHLVAHTNQNAPR